MQGIFFSPVEIDEDLLCSGWEKCVVPILSGDFFFFRSHVAMLSHLFGKFVVPS